MFFIPTHFVDTIGNEDEHLRSNFTRRSDINVHSLEETNDDQIDTSRDTSEQSPPASTAPPQPPADPSLPHQPSSPRTTRRVVGEVQQNKGYLTAVPLASSYVIIIQQTANRRAARNLGYAEEVVCCRGITGTREHRNGKEIA
jgi:hypothetical protein